MSFTEAVTGALAGANPLVAAGAAVADTVVGFLGNSQQNKYNMQLMKYQNAWNERMWERQNEYNSPKATMERLVAAGINPRAYQEIGQFANAAAPPPAAKGDKISELSAFQSVARQALENQMLQEDILKKKQDRKLSYRRELREDFKLNADKLDYFIKSLTNGVQPEQFVDEWHQLLEEFGNENMFNMSPLYRDFTNEEKSVYMLNRAGIRTRNDAEAAIKKLRELEHTVKKREHEDYVTYGVTKGGSALGDIPKMIIRLIEFIGSAFNIH